MKKDNKHITDDQATHMTMIVSNPGDATGYGVKLGDTINYRLVTLINKELMEKGKSKVKIVANYNEFRNQMQWYELQIHKGYATESEQALVKEYYDKELYPHSITTFDRNGKIEEIDDEI